MDRASDQKIFTIAAGQPFLAILAKALMEGRLIDGFCYRPDDPLSLADATIYVPTRRAARGLRSEIIDRIGARSAILPVIRPLGETEEDTDWLDDLADDTDGLAPIGALDRLLELSSLVLAWRNHLPTALADLHEGSPLVAPASPADAIWMARHLVELIDAMETEGCDWASLAQIDSSDHALWWQLTGQFLGIASEFWPKRLAELGFSSPSAHRNAVLEREAIRIETGTGLVRKGPVIVAGSTGSMPATARLIRAISRAPMGAVVLPGLDQAMHPDEFRMAGGLDADGQLDTAPASRSHPQYSLFHLIRRLGIARVDVIELGKPAGHQDLRTAVLSRAMLPSDMTASWQSWRSTLNETELQDAFAPVSLVEAANERTEATAIAIALKLAVTTAVNAPRRQAALITPDRNLARRVGLELARFGIIADDSAGTPLLSSPQGSLTHLALECILRPGDPVALAGLIKHPLIRLGLPADLARSAANILEVTALRGGSADCDPSLLAGLVDAAASYWIGDRHPPAWRLALPEGAIDQAKDLAQRLALAIEPLASALLTGEKGRRTASLSFADWADRTARVLEALAMDDKGSLEALWSDESGDALASLMSSLIASKAAMVADGPQWIDVLTAMMAGEGVRPKVIEHPRVFIWGSLEARLQNVDTVILGGLNEGMWPGTASANPFLSRLMKTSIGLEPPERRIGQSAHDFIMAAAQSEVILTRSLREGTTPTVPSRFLQRLLAVTGDKVTSGMKARGADILDMVEAIDHAPSTPAPGRPEPFPPADLQPKRYSFSEVSKLRRDPYAIHARRILRLDPIKPFNREPGPAERGTIYHAIVEQFLKSGHRPDTADGEAAMMAIAHQAFDEAKLPEHVDAVWRPRFFGVARAFLAFETERMAESVESFTEVPARFDIEGHDLTLTGIADRIDLLADGTADIIDYKTGSNPSRSIARALLDPQLALEAAALAGGAFRKISKAKTRKLIYVRLKPGESFAVDVVNNMPGDRVTKGVFLSADDLAEKSLVEFVKLVNGLRDGRHGFISRLIPMKANDYAGDYDHLARVAEWSVAEEEPDGSE